MRKIIIAVLSLVVITSCTDTNENLKETQNSETNLLLNSFEKQKKITEIHNTMLENSYNYIAKKKEENKVVKLDIVTDVDDIIIDFIDANNAIFSKNILTKGGGTSRTNLFNELKKLTLANRVLYPKTKGSNSEIKVPAYLDLFCKKFFSKPINIDNLDADIKLAMDSVLEIYPNLSKNEIEALTSVAGVAYNSSLYWFKHREKWIKSLGSTPQTKGFWKDAWNAVKEGTQDCVEADVEGAATTIAAGWLVHAATGGMDIAAGAAIGSLLGGIKSAYDGITNY